MTTVPRDRDCEENRTRAESGVSGSLTGPQLAPSPAGCVCPCSDTHHSDRGLPGEKRGHGVIRGGPRLCETQCKLKLHFKAVSSTWFSLQVLASRKRTCWFYLQEVKRDSIFQGRSNKQFWLHWFQVYQHSGWVKKYNTH